MPEHDTFDLDAAFRALEQDVTSLSTAPGAGAAVARARRRRRTTVGAVAAAAVLAVGGVAIGHGLIDHDHAVVPSHELPTPALWDDAQLSAATGGWTPAWSEDEAGPYQEAKEAAGSWCVTGIGYFDGYSTNYFMGNDRGDMSYTIFSDDRNDARQAGENWRSLRGQLQGCDRASLVSRYSTDGVVGETYRVSPIAPLTTPTFVWIVRTGASIGLLGVFDQTDPLPVDVDMRVGRALLAGALDPASYSVRQSGGTKAPRTDVGSVGADDLAQAFGDWPNRWHQEAARVGSIVDLPACAQGWATTARGGQGSRVGDDGGQAYRPFDSPAEAHSALGALTQELQDCSAPTFGPTTTRETEAGGLVTTASAEAPGDPVVWAVQHGRYVGYVLVPGSGTPPSEVVDQQVAALIEAALPGSAS